MNKTPHRSEIQNVVVILAGSRTGSTFLFDQLASTEKFHCPQGEETPYYRKAGIGNIQKSSDSDAIYTIPDASKLDTAAEMLLADSGIPTKFLEDIPTFADAVKYRISVQWPNLIETALSRSADEVIRLMLKKLPRDYCNWQKFYLDVLSVLARKKISLEDSMLTPLTGTIPSTRLWEETPFIFPSPRRRIETEQLEHFPLLLKTSSNVYRTSFLKSLFPKANFKWVIIKRNPAATISALIDGWRSGGFHSHYLPEGISLNIKNYSDTRELGDKFWKFDLPPDWIRYCQSDLAEVCGFQWLSAYSAIEKFLKETKDEVFISSYENFIGPDAQRHLNEILAFSKGKSCETQEFDLIRKSAQVSDPGAFKWKKRASEISSCIRNFQNGKIIEAAKKFDYDFERIETWI